MVIRILAAFGLALAPLVLAAQDAQRPDILFIAVDDLNDWVGVLGGHPQTKTPNIDRLAARGLLFTNAHTAAPLCTALGVQVRADERLAEFEIDGEYLGADGSAPEDRPDLMAWEPHHQAREDGETLREFSLRVFACCDWLARRHAGQRVVAVSHSGTIDAAIRWALGVAADQRWEADMPIETASITELVHWPDGRREGGAPRYTSLLRIGDQAHLGDLIESAWQG